ncbi:MAG: hypothetical protein HRF49_10815 [bacterium]
MQIHLSGARFRLAVCGRRFGKSIAAAHEAAFAMMGPDARVWVVAPYRELAGRVWQRARDVLVRRLKLSADSDRRPEMFLRLANGSELCGKTADNPDSLLGEGLDFVVVDEAPRVAGDVFARYVLPSLADRRGRALIIGSPRGRGWVWRLAARASADPDWDVFRFGSSENPHLSPEELAMHRRLLAFEDYQREYEAEWISERALVYPMFDPVRHVSKAEFNPELPLYAGVDFGFTNPGCALFAQVTPSEDLIVLDEIYARGLTAVEWAEKINAKAAEITAARKTGMRNSADEMYMRFARERLHERRAGAYSILRDPDRGGGAARYAAAVFTSAEERASRIAAAFCDPAGAGERAVLERAGIPALAPRAGVEAGIARVRALLAPGDKAAGPRIAVSPKCRNLIREFGSYEYEEQGRRAPDFGLPDANDDIPLLGWGARGTERVAKRDDHALDALRYLVTGLGI